MNNNYKSQIGQDKWVIEEVFKGMTHGYFIEMGAGNGIDLSNTYILEKNYDWEGLCIEPNQKSFEKLLKNRNCHCDNNFVLSDNEQVDFIEYGDTGTHQDYFSSNNPWKEFDTVDIITKTHRILPAVSLTTLLQKYRAPTMIHYMSLDVEGNELPILIDFFQRAHNTRTRVVAMSVEHNFQEPRRTEIRKLLESNDYIYVRELMHDDLYVHASLYNLIYI